MENVRMAGRKRLRVGFDFDGVIAYNPFRILRAPTNILKKVIGHEKKLHFYYPKSTVEQWFWILVHETSFFPSPGLVQLKEMLSRGDIEGYIITSRYACLEPSFYRWLKKHGLDRAFQGYHLNVSNNQPHIHKERVLADLKLDYFIDDNFDIVRHLDQSLKKRGIATQVHWIYNVVDRFTDYPYKHPYLAKFLDALPIDSRAAGKTAR